MKLNIRLITKILSVTFCAFVLIGCQYEDIRTATYPDNMIYMPTAKNGLYVISSATADSVSPATIGAPYRYQIDNTNNKLIIPLGVYLSGTKSQSDFDVSIALDNDTVTNMLSQSVYTGYQTLPANNISVPATITYSKGAEYIGFNVLVDLNFLKSNLTTKYLFAVKISSADVKSNQNLSTTIIKIDPQFLATATH